MNWGLLLLTVVCEIFSTELKHFKDEDVRRHDEYTRYHRVIHYDDDESLQKVRWSAKKDFQVYLQPVASKKNKRKSVRQHKSGSSDIGIFENEFLKAHNEYRKQHGVPPLSLSETLCKYAEEWALIISKKGIMEHRDQKKYGENLFYGWSSSPNFEWSGKIPVDEWYNEIKEYTFGEEPISLDAGHFTQVVWKNTKEVGVALAKSPNGGVYVVANYYPPGNLVGEFAANVPPPID